MKCAPSFLVGLVLLSFCAAAQTTPPPKAQAGKGKPRTATPLRTAAAVAVRMDTAAFRRSGRPTDGPVRLPVQKRK